MHVLHDIGTSCLVQITVFQGNNGGFQRGLGMVLKMLVEYAVREQT